MPLPFSTAPPFHFFVPSGFSVASRFLARLTAPLYCGSHLDEKFHRSQTELGVALAYMVIGEGKAPFKITA